ncbi:hypothetical protein ABRY23_11160 [Melioribacteraceae bacterium 4301-Me]|uniref:hypothetical protein n=1 Tax=Pyranulibacter aquaticus TaxID=3163344 RepID=UPI003596DD9C
MKSKLFLVLIMNLICTITWGQNYPKIKNARIWCSVVYSLGDSLYYYKYSIYNDITSSGDIFSFDIDISLSQEQNVDVDTIGLKFKNELLRSFFSSSYNFIQGKAVPFGVSETPNDYALGYPSLNYSVSFFGFGYLKPGDSLNNFEINTKGIPSIRRVTFSIAKDTIIDQLPSIEDTTSDMTESQMDSLLSSLDYNTWTIGPNFFADDLSLVNIIDSIISYNQRAYDLNWIREEQVKNKYLLFLSDAKTSIQQNNLVQARSYLENIVSEVNIDSSSFITSEAYALLRYNTEYLLSKLPQPPSGMPVKLINSTGRKLPGGSLQYYESGWKNAIDNGDGTFIVNTQLKKVSLRMTYQYGSQTKSNVDVSSDTVVFQTVNTLVKLQDSQGNLIDGGTVQYYASGWHSFGTATNGIATKELLPVQYTFRMTYSFASNDKTQNLDTNSTVVFKTVKASVQLKDSQNNLITEEGTVKYYAGGWRDFGVTVNGVANKELLPNNYTFRMSYAFASKDKQQNIGTNPVVEFQTVNVVVQLRDSQNNLIDTGTIQYYSGGWREFGRTTNGEVSKELLPNNYTFRITYEFVSNDKAQNIGTNNTVVFTTVLCTVRVTDRQNQPIDNATVRYYSGGWRDLGTTVNGEATKELLPANLTFRVNYNGIQQDKTQNIGTNNVVEFSL